MECCSGHSDAPKSNNSKRNMLYVAGAALLALLYVGLIHANEPTTPAELARQRMAAAFNDHAVDSAISLLRTGDVVLRMGQGADSRLLALINRKNKDYSHCGIVMMEGGRPYVYHSIGGEEAPDARLRRDDVAFFFSPRRNSRIAVIRYNADATQVAALCNVVQQYYHVRPRFDMQFDLGTDDKLYCSEFVYKAMNRAMNDTSYITPTRAIGRTFVGIDDLFLNRHAQVVWQVAFK